MFLSSVAKCTACIWGSTTSRKVTEEYKSKLSSSTQYKEKQMCGSEFKHKDETSCENTGSVRVLNKTTAEKLLKEQMLQKQYVHVLQNLSNICHPSQKKKVWYMEKIFLVKRYRLELKLFL